MSRLLETHARIVGSGAGATTDGAATHRAGDVVRLELQAALDADASPRWPTREELQQALGGHAIVLDEGSDVAAHDQVVAGKAVAHSWGLQLLLPPGEGSLGPIPLVIMGPDGAELERGEVPAVTVTIATVLDAPAVQELEAKKEAPELKADMTKLLAAPRGPWELRSQWPLGWIALTLACAALVAWAAWRIAKRPRRVAPAPPPELPEVVAHRRLAALAASHGLERRQHLAFHVNLADILRRYLSGRLGTDLTELTTDEVRRMLRGELRSHAALALGATTKAGEARLEIVRLLTSCDHVKFARHEPAPVESLELLRDVGRLVDMTTPTHLPAAGLPGPRPASAPTPASTDSHQVTR